MIYYTLRINNMLGYMFETKEDAEECKRHFEALTSRKDLYIIERRTNNDTIKEETRT